MNYKIKTINGITTIFVDMPYSNSITTQIFVKAGSIYENKKTNGLSHFLEHMFFKGGEKYTTPQAVSQAIDLIGGDFGAYTADEYASYYTKVAPEFVDKALDVLSDMMINAKFPQDEMEKEKDVVIQEILMYEDMPHRLIFDKWKRFFYGDNPYGWSISGSIETVKSFTQQDLFDHKRNLYTKDNLIIVVAGKILDSYKIQSIIGDLFGNLPEKKLIDKEKLPNYCPATHEEFFEKGTQQAHIIIGCKGFKSIDDNKYIANLIGIIMGGNMSSRLFQRIREEKGLCYYISSTHYAGQDDGIFITKAGLDKSKLDFGLKSIYEEIEKIQNKDITKSEFEKAVSYIKGKTKMGIETSDEMAEFVGTQYLFHNEIKTLDEILACYEKVSLDDVNDLANTMFKKENLYLYGIL